MRSTAALQGDHVRPRGKDRRKPGGGDLPVHLEVRELEGDPFVLALEQDDASRQTGARVQGHFETPPGSGRAVARNEPEAGGADLRDLPVTLEGGHRRAEEGRRGPTGIDRPGLHNRLPIGLVEPYG